VIVALGMLLPVPQLLWDPVGAAKLDPGAPPSAVVTAPMGTRPTLALETGNAVAGGEIPGAPPLTVVVGAGGKLVMKVTWGTVTAVVITVTMGVAAVVMATVWVKDMMVAGGGTGATVMVLTFPDAVVMTVSEVPSVTVGGLDAGAGVGMSVIVLGMAVQIPGF